MTDETARSLALITRKLGFAPWGGCDECPNPAYCARRERVLPILPCELDDASAGVDPYKPPRQNAWDWLLLTKRPENIGRKLPDRWITDGLLRDIKAGIEYLVRELPKLKASPQTAVANSEGFGLSAEFVEAVKKARRPPLSWDDPQTRETNKMWDEETRRRRGIEQ